MRDDLIEITATVSIMCPVTFTVTYNVTREEAEEAIESGFLDAECDLRQNMLGVEEPDVSNLRDDEQKAFDAAVVEAVRAALAAEGA